MVLQCNATVLKEQLKLCLAAEGFGNRLCFLEPTSNAQVCREGGTGGLGGSRERGGQRPRRGVWEPGAGTRRGCEEGEGLEV